MSPQRRAPRRARACLLADVLIFSGCAVVALQSVGSAWSYYQHGRQARRQQAYDAVYGSSFWTDDCMLEHVHARNSKPSHYYGRNSTSHYYANVSKGVCTLGYVGDALEERQAMVRASPSLNVSATATLVKYGFLGAAFARRTVFPVFPLFLSMPIGTEDIASKGRSAPADYREKFEEQHSVATVKLYEALDAAGQIPPLAPHANTPVFEWNQLKVALNVGDGLYRGTTDVAKGVEIAFVVDKFFYGNEHTFEYMKLWDPSWKITQDFLRLADVASFDELTLAPLPTKTGYVIAEGVGGVSGLRWLPEGQIASSPGGGQRVKRKRDEKDGREMRCYRVGCGESFIYCPNDGVWKDDAVHESTSFPGVQCPKCTGRGCKFVQ